MRIGCESQAVRKRFASDSQAIAVVAAVAAVAAVDAINAINAIHKFI